MSYIDEFDALGKGEKAPGRLRRKPHAHIQPDRIWVVLARRAYDQPLRAGGHRRGGRRRPGQCLRPHHLR